MSELDKERALALQAIQGSVLPDEQLALVTGEKKQEIDYDSRNEALDYKIRLDKIMSRKRWDSWLLRLVVVGFFLSYLMIIAIGLGWLKFADSTFAVPSVVAAGVLETYGLARIAAQYFFSDDVKK